MHNDTRKFFAAASQAQVKSLTKLLESSIAPNAADAHGNTALIYAAGAAGWRNSDRTRENALRCVQLLLAAGADVTKANDRGCVTSSYKEKALGFTTAMAAAEAGNDRILQLILERWPAAVSQVDEQGRTALMYAARHKQTKCVELLYLADPAAATQADEYGHTAVDHARQVLAHAPQAGYRLGDFGYDADAHSIATFLRTQQAARELRSAIHTQPAPRPAPMPATAASVAAFSDIL
jgi:ankyrin repeat protein